MTTDHLPNDLQKKLAAAKQVVTDSRLRTLAGKKKMLVENGNVYGERIDEVEFERLINQAYTDEALRSVFLVTLRETPMSVEALAEKTGLQPAMVFQHILVLQRKGLVEIERVENNIPLYRSIEAE